MGLRYRKSINLGGGFRINISRSGIGYSWGVKGYRVTKTAKGTTRRTASIPGTGISFVNETGKRKVKHHQPSKPQPAAPAIDTNHCDTEEIVNSAATDMVSEGMEELLSAVRRTVNANAIANIGILLFLILASAYPIFIIFLLASAALKIYAKTAGLIDLEYVVDEDQQEAVTQRTAPMLKVTDSQKVWRIVQSSKVIDKKYSSGATGAVKRIACTVGKKAPFPFKADIPVAYFKAKKETLIFFPDKLFILQKNKVGALSYSDISITPHTTNFVETEKVPKDTQVIEQTWKYVNQSGAPDRRFKNNPKIPVCLYGAFELTSASGLNTIIMFSNPNLL